MYGVHTCIVTKSKPWTTVSNTFQGTDIDVLKLCQVKLVYLRNHKYGKLIPKDFIGQSSYVTPSFNLASMAQLPQPPPPQPTPAVSLLVRELKTANTLLDLHGTDNTKTSVIPVEPENIELPDIRMLWTRSWVIVQSLLQNMMPLNQLMPWTVLCLPNWKM